MGSTVNWKSRLANYKSHISKGKKTCRIVCHFLEECNVDPLTKLRFVILDVVNNADELPSDELETLLLNT